MSEVIEITREEIQIEVNKAYKKGYIDATKNLAIWNDGAQYVGTMQVPLKQVVDNIENQFGFDLNYK